MKLISSLALMAAFMVGPQTVSAATVFSPPVIADTAAGTGTSAKYYRLAACAWDSTNKAILTSTCGQQTADYFCNSVKGGPAVSFTIGYTGYEKTYFQSGAAVCEPASGTTTAALYYAGAYNACLGFSTITCTHEAFTKDSAGKELTGAPGRRLRGNEIPRILVEEEED